MYFEKKLRLEDYLPNTSVDAELKCFKDYLINFRHLSATTIVSTVGTVKFYLYELMGTEEFNISLIKAETLKNFLSRTLLHVSPASKKRL